jgi:hypothetical protein
MLRQCHDVAYGQNLTNTVHCVPSVPNDDLDKATGVVSEIDGRGFEAVAVIDGNNHHLGRFNTAEQAKEAVEQAQANYLAAPSGRPRYSDRN